VDSPNLAIWPNWVKYCSLSFYIYFYEEKIKINQNFFLNFLIYWRTFQTSNKKIFWLQCLCTWYRKLLSKQICIVVIEIGEVLSEAHSYNWQSSWYTERCNNSNWKIKCSWKKFQHNLYLMLSNLTVHFNPNFHLISRI
jgi:hypothetical protein